MTEPTQTAVVAGIGEGLGNALGRQLAEAGYRVAGLARGTKAGEALLESLGADRFLPIRCDLTDATQVGAAISEVEDRFGPVSVYVHNAARLHMQPFLETEPSELESLWRTVCLGAAHGAQRVLPTMLERKQGALLFIGATASVKAGANFSAFGSAKFALRGLAQSLARELGPQGIHVAHLIIDGVMWGDRARDSFKMSKDRCLAPEAVARTCMHLLEQDRSAWTHELDIRPDVENF
ncbi:MAG: SDR family NAD(P)-dependent oxidoreductase [Pseudomonadota bacterium]|nr:SDR family NAD(P)-dependent oxidoreductase [Pseudomonadota bacterium]